MLKIVKVIFSNFSNKIFKVFFEKLLQTHFHQWIFYTDVGRLKHGPLTKRDGLLRFDSSLGDVQTGKNVPMQVGKFTFDLFLNF
jgi:hypothetical protein